MCGQGEGFAFPTIARDKGAMDGSPERLWKPTSGDTAARYGAPGTRFKSQLSL